MYEDIEERVTQYWNLRAHDFAKVRKNELKDSIRTRWLEEIEAFIPEGRKMKILDVGTGTGYFPILLGKMGHEVTGIDITENMLEEAKKQAASENVSAKFLAMDAQNLGFDNEQFDMVISRNLT